MEKGELNAAAEDVAKQLQLLPGFRFHPTDEELVVHYLATKAASRPFTIQIIAELDLYKFNPWDLPQKALIGEREWYFFSPRDRKYPNGARPNRAAASGYWKATGTDKPIYSSGGEGVVKVGVKKALVFYKGKAPRGTKTNWILHEYRLTDSRGKPSHAKRKGSLRLDDWVLCRIYNRSVGSQKLKLSDQNSEAREDLSCLDDVLASLPDIDETKISTLPRSGSHSTANNDQNDDPQLIDEYLHGELSEEDSFIEEFLNRDQYNLSENGSKTVPTNYQESNIQNSEQTRLQLANHSSRLSYSELDHPQSHDPTHLNDHSPRLDSFLKRPREMKIPEIQVQNLRSVKQRGSFDSTDDEVQSTCRSPIFSKQNQGMIKQQMPTDFEPHNFWASSVDRWQCQPAHDLVQLKTEDMSGSYFVNMDDLFRGHLNRFIS